MTTAYHSSENEDFVSAAGSRMADSGWGRRPPSDDGSDPFHAVCVQDCDILQQLASPLPTAPTYPKSNKHHCLVKLVMHTGQHDACVRRCITCTNSSLHAWTACAQSNVEAAKTKPITAKSQHDALVFHGRPESTICCCHNNIAQVGQQKRQHYTWWHILPHMSTMSNHNAHVALCPNLKTAVHAQSTRASLCSIVCTSPTGPT